MTDRAINFIHKSISFNKKVNLNLSIERESEEVRLPKFYELNVLSFLPINSLFNRQNLCLYRNDVQFNLRTFLFFKYCCNALGI